MVRVDSEEIVDRTQNFIHALHVAHSRVQLAPNEQYSLDRFQMRLGALAEEVQRGKGSTDIFSNLCLQLTVLEVRIPR